MRFDVLRQQKKVNDKFCHFYEEMLDDTKPHEFEKKRRINEVPGLLHKMQASVENNNGYFIPSKAAWFPIINLNKCGTKGSGYGDPNSIKIVDGKFQSNLIVQHANYCGSRSCAICTARLAHKYSLQLEYKWSLVDQDEYDFLFLTLTVPNSSEGFRKSVDYMRKAFNKFLLPQIGGSKYVKTKFVPLESIYGQFEVTISSRKNNGVTYWHPHLHIILAYKKSEVIEREVAQSGKIKKYTVYKNKPHTQTITFDNNMIRKMWFEACQSVSDGYFPTKDSSGRDLSEIGYECRLEPVVSKEGTGSAIKEVSKYLTRLFDINNSNDFLTYLKDSYGLHTRIKYGFLSFRSEDEEDFHAWLDARREARKQNNAQLDKIENVTELSFFFVHDLLENDYSFLLNENIYYLYGKQEDKLYVKERKYVHIDNSINAIETNITTINEEIQYQYTINSILNAREGR